MSYAREDWERIRPLAQSLEALGWSVWWDTRMRTGVHFDEMIEAELATAPCVMVVWTEASIGSHWVRAEAAEALEQHKLIPLFLDKVKAPLQFRLVQGLDFKGWDGSPDHSIFRRLVEDASQLADPPAQPVLEPARVKSEVESPRPPATSDRPPARKAQASEVAGPEAQRIVEPEMVRIEPGTFLMGSAKGSWFNALLGRAASPDECPQHEVRIDRPFGMGRYPVTFEEYEAFATATKRDPPGDQGWGRGRRPVINVSWEDAVAYARWFSEQTGKRYRLPSEAEWEYATRAGTATPWSFGDDEQAVFPFFQRQTFRAATPWSFGDNKQALGKYAWYSGNAGSQTHPVGEKEPNPWGLHDVHGNVWEWVQDCWHKNYEGAPTDGSAWQEEGGVNCGRRVLRGDSWFYKTEYLRSAARPWNYAVNRLSGLGFRLAQDL